MLRVAAVIGLRDIVIELVFSMLGCLVRSPVLALVGKRRLSSDVMNILVMAVAVAVTVAIVVAFMAIVMMAISFLVMGRLLGNMHSLVDPLGGEVLCRIFTSPFFVHRSMLSMMDRLSVMDRHSVMDRLSMTGIDGGMLSLMFIRLMLVSDSGVLMVLIVVV